MLLIHGAALAVAIVLGSGDPASIDLASVEAQLDRAWSAHSGFTAIVKETVWRGPRSSRTGGGGGRQYREGGVWITRGSYAELRVDDRVLFRLDTERYTQPTADQEAKRDDAQRTTVVCDGSNVYTHMAGTDIASKRPALPSSRPGAQLAFRRKDHSLRLLPSDELNGEPVFVIEGVRTGEARGPWKRFLWYYSHAGVRVKEEWFRSDGKLWKQKTMEDVKLSPALSEEQFVWYTPRGVHVQELKPGQPLQMRAPRD